MNNIDFKDDIEANRTSFKSSASGVIFLGELEEGFSSSLAVWSKNQYRLSWLYSIQIFFRTGKSALITQWSPSVERDGISGRMYSIYCINNRKIAIRDNLILNQRYKNIWNGFPLIPPSRVRSKVISEWQCSTNDLNELADNVYMQLQEGIIASNKQRMRLQKAAVHGGVGRSKSTEKL